MNNSIDNNIAKPWYRETWFWFVISPMLTLLITIPILISTAIKGADDRVVDDYYKEGRMIHKRFDAEALAKELAIAGVFEVNWEQGKLRFTATRELPDRMLNAYFSHPAKAAKDVAVEFKRLRENVYVAAIDSLDKSRWYVSFEGRSTTGQPWRIQAEIDLTTGSSFQVMPALN